MKRFFCIFSVILLTLTGCGTTEQVNEDKLQVYTSFYCIYDFAKKIGGDKIDVYNVIPAGTEPHDWEPTAHDMASLSKADVLFYNGLGMEHWVDKVNSSVNIKAVALSDYAEVDNQLDPHIWLDPENADDMAEGIYQVLCQLDSENSQYYADNYNSFKNQLELLDNAFEQQLQPYENSSIVVAHEAYGYMCRAYDLNQISIDGISADSEPSPQKMQEIINFIKDNNIKAVFYEELISKKTAETIAAETNAVLLPLNPFEGLSAEEIEAGEDYISVMEENLANLKTAMEG